jgi:hypothetical protein
VLGKTELANAVAFYSHDHPDAVPYFDIRLAPWVTPVRFANEGSAAVCPAEDARCLAEVGSLTEQNPAVERSDVEIVPRFLGFKGQPARFVIVVAPPRMVASRG